ncbi:MAG: M14 metallopeptidase family protein [Niabella sp.]
MAQIQSPEQFLGYKIGTQYTPHYRVAEYFKHLAQQAPNMVKLQQYGTTNEGRPLYLAFVSNAENIQDLENIRMNNLRLAKQSSDAVGGNSNAPAIVWLSYNVHGNETSSTEAALLTVYALIDPANQQTKQWLKNTVVIIDPCLNPDGRERYVNWYTSVLGKQYNAKGYAREHFEPWPGGRSNHYYFDMNRDWAWQTQKESKERVKQYNQWLPQIHVDFHEQGFNEPYYFAPAAEPYHEVITQWQRDFQKTIGTNHAKHFDKNGWLYFTNERFDLLYPSYGDTYPIYNGSIGMTYEQGGIRAGLGIITADGDTLTLVDRVLHHFTTSLSTIEIVSKHASELVNEFKKYFDTNHSGVYKSYIIKNKPEDRERIQALLQLFNNNKIEYGHASGSGNGYDYATGKNSSFSITGEDIVVSGLQPKSALVRVLFDPNPKLTDSVTYDITTWALPYAYGLTAYACKQSFTVNNKGFSLAAPQNNITDAYGYIIKWQGVQSAGAVAKLLNAGVNIRQSETAFSIGAESFPAGSAIILKKGNETLGDLLSHKVSNICTQKNIQLYTVNTGMVQKGFDFGSSRVHLLKPPTVVLLTGKQTSSLSVGEVWHFMEQELDYPVTLIEADQLSRFNLDNINVLILPDGNFNFDEFLSKKLEDWVKSGGRIIAFENAAAQLSACKWSKIKPKKTNNNDSANTKDVYASIKSYEDRERNEVQKYTPGAVIKVDVDNTHPLMFGYPKYYYSLKMDDKIYEFIKDGGWNVGVIKNESQLSGYIGYQLKPLINNALVFGVQNIGKGTVVFLTDDVLFRNFWQNGKLIFVNALFANMEN